LHTNIYADTWITPYIQAELFVQNNEYAKAEPLYLDSITKDPNQASTYLGLAQVYLEKNNFQKAKEILEKAKTSNIGFERENIQKYRLLMMSLSARTGDIESLKDFQEQYLSNSNDIPRTYREGEYIYITNAPKTRAERVFMESILKKHDNVCDIQWRGDIGIAKVACQIQRSIDNSK